MAPNRPTTLVLLPARSECMKSSTCSLVIAVTRLPSLGFMCTLIRDLSLTRVFGFLSLSRAEYSSQSSAMSCRSVAQFLAGRVLPQSLSSKHSDGFLSRNVRRKNREALQFLPPPGSFQCAVDDAEGHNVRVLTARHEAPHFLIP